MQITRNSIETQKGPADWFTGDVYIDAVAAPAGTSTFAAAAAHFTPGARTAWHTHPHGQTIFVTEGVGLCQREGGQVEFIRPGDRVFFEPDENHWHGAAPDRFMVHIAMQQNDDTRSPVTRGEHVTDVLGACTVKPMVNQILVHIANTPQDLISYSQEQGLLVEAYSPIAHGELLKNERVPEIADKYDVSVPQLSIRYTLQLGLLPLPKTENPEHMKSNAQVGFDISDEDMETLKSIDPLDDYGEASAMPVFGGSLA